MNTTQLEGQARLICENNAPMTTYILEHYQLKFAGRCVYLSRFYLFLFFYKNESKIAEPVSCSIRVSYILRWNA
jgi:hypothetical protein